MESENTLPLGVRSNRAPRRWAPPLVAVVLSAVVILSVGRFTPALMEDAGEYIKLAEGRTSEVLSPLTARFLGPLIVRGMVATGLVSLPVGFGILNTASLLLLTWAVAHFAEYLLGRAELTAVFILTPAVLLYYENGYGPELFHAAVTAVFFLLLMHERWLAALSLIPVLYFIREATLLLVIVAALIAWVRGSRRFALGIAAAGLIGAVVSSMVVAMGAPNVHSIHPVAYTATKLPFNFIKNILGMPIWINTFTGAGHLPPFWKTQLPSWARLGAIREIGLEPYQPFWQLRTATAWLTVFGVLPTVAWFLWRRRGDAGGGGEVPQRQRMPYWMSVAVAYGVLCFLIAPGLGASVGRIVSYAWPLFWLALPVLLVRHLKPGPAELWPLIVCHLIASWLPAAATAAGNLNGRDWDRVFWTIGVAIVVASAALHVGAWRMLAAMERRRRHRRDENLPSHAAGAAQLTA